VLIPLAKSEDPAIRKNAIWGLGEVLRLKRKNPDASVLTGLLAGADVQTQREIILALSKSPYEETTAQVIRPFLLNLDPELRVAAVHYFEREPAVLYEMTKILNLPIGSVSEETRLLALNSVKKYFPDTPLFRDSLLHLGEQEASLSVRLEALALLAGHKDPQAAQLLLKLFDEASGSQKRKIIVDLLTNFEDHPTLLKTVKKIVEFYQDPRYHFDLFDIIGQEHVLSQRLSLLRNDPEALQYISSLDTRSNPGLAEFIAVVFP
ncbi:MAG: HEAT repeat domain-containing protein, partial [Deltaproteobacteria bacterium]|nr:HEAT repeat domain-containing protein [Deltaproteobacteria bacterium]